MAVKGQGQAISCTTEPRICEGPTRKWGMILRGQEEGLGEHRDESTSFVEHVFFVIFLVIVCGDLFGYFVLFRYREMKGRYVRIFCRRGFAWERRIYDGGSNMIFDFREDKWI